MSDDPLRVSIVGVPGTPQQLQAAVEVARMAEGAGHTVTMNLEVIPATADIVVVVGKNVEVPPGKIGLEVAADEQGSVTRHGYTGPAWPGPAS